jgi:histidinol-phosphate/aromatic aminotransferase/cobyric acid decarboxylase-like protein
MATYQSFEVAPRTQSRSAYMEWAKLRSKAKYNLASSGMAGLTMADLGVSIEQLEINQVDSYGYEPLHRAIATRYRVPVECVVPALGTSMANYFALAACADPGDEVLIEQPTYGLLLDTSRYLGFDVKRFGRPAEDDYQIDLSDLRRKISPRTRLIVLCNLHNPTSVLTPESTLREIATWRARLARACWWMKSIWSCYGNRSQRAHSISIPKYFSAPTVLQRLMG